MGSTATMAAAAKPTLLHGCSSFHGCSKCRHRLLQNRATLARLGEYNLRDLNLYVRKLPLQFSLLCGGWVPLVNCTISPCSKQCEGV